MRRLLLLGVVLALAMPVAASGERAATAKSPPSVLALQTSRGGDVLVRVGGATLTPMSRGLNLGGHASAWSFSPDGRRLAIGVDSVRGFRIVDVRRLRRVARVQTWSSEISTLAWLAPRRIVGIEPAGLFVFDPVARKHLRPPELSGDIQCVKRSGNLLVLLLAPSQQIGPARLAVIDGSADVRVVQLDEIQAGFRPELVAQPPEARSPGLALDPAGRAYVIGAAGEPIAEVALDSLGVSYHQPTRERSLLTRLRDWLEPAAAAKLPLTGSFRIGHWLGDGKLAFWGHDSAAVGADRAETAPAGLSVVDTMRWTLRTVDDSAWNVAFAADTLLVSYRRGGLSGYTTGGDRRYHLFDGEPLGVVATFGTRAFVAFDHKPMRVVDAATGRSLGTRRAAPRVLDAAFSTW